jgi:pyruvate,orthophosphate dikinase
MDHRYVFDFDAPPPGPADELPAVLGGKGANLALMANDLGLPVPPGFTITTDACRSFLRDGWPNMLDAELGRHLERLGERVGRRFGDEADPLLVSVRSGAPVSMPGMMDTVLNLGLTDAATRGLAAATGDEAFAADCLRRFRESYRAVIGTGAVPEDPRQQLRAAIEAVFRSWNGERAVAYRRHEGIADELGTAVTVQAMVFGNRGADSGTGVLFSRNPSTGEPALYGDIMFDAQGEDVVAGTHEPEPLSVLDERLPAVAAELRRHVDVLEHHFADLCDIEFTIEEGQLWFLQVRVGKRSPRAALRMAIDMAEEDRFPLARADAVRRIAHLLADPPRTFVAASGGPAPIARGRPASPGIATGAIATSSEAAQAAKAAGSDVIMVRQETSPEDVAGMAAAAGILTARGGLASHAAVVARGWGIPAVVGATDVHPHDSAVEIGGRTFAAGDVITIDGGSGEIYGAAIQGTWEATPEAVTLRSWADELGIEIGQPAAGDGSSAPPPPGARTDLARPGADDVARALLIRGSVTVDQLAEAVVASPEHVQAALDEATAAGLAEAVADGMRLTAQGKLAAAKLIAADGDRVGSAQAAQMLDAFHALDGRMKEIVTRWQVREVDGETALNDHSDAAYDRAVLDDLGALETETVNWLAPLADALRPFAAYRARLGRAMQLVRDGDARFIASPRVDSVHSAWFELHEDLIRLAGRRREDVATDPG